jgi:hypothetical protein
VPLGNGVFTGGDRHALQMANAPDAQLGFSAQWGLSTLGVSTRGDRWQQQIRFGAQPKKQFGVGQQRRRGRGGN